VVGVTDEPDPLSRVEGPDGTVVAVAEPETGTVGAGLARPCVLALPDPVPEPAVDVPPDAAPGVETADGDGMADASTATGTAASTGVATSVVVGCAGATTGRPGRNRIGSR
jgi:hypothetical protein